MDFEEDFDVLDPERLIQCPLVKHHWIRARRFPYHLVKCKERNPEIAKKFATCPFNARHLVPHNDLRNHIMKCKDKALMDQDVVSRSCEPPREQLNNGSTWQPPPCDEDWETELQEGAESTFVWSVTNPPLNRIRSINSSPRNSVLPQQ